MICLVRLIVAAVCGLLIGVEWQTRMKGAGSRTHMMVSLGAALMTLVSSYGFLPIVGAAGVSVDVSRVAASIAAGIGFHGDWLRHVCARYYGNCPHADCAGAAARCRAA